MTEETFDKAYVLRIRIAETKESIFNLEIEKPNSKNRAYLVIPTAYENEAKIKIPPSVYDSIVSSMLTDYTQQLFDLEREFEQL
jgi:hypothetical protein